MEYEINKFQKLYSGIWEEKVENGHRLIAGGNFLGPSPIVVLDFDQFRLPPENAGEIAKETYDTMPSKAIYDKWVGDSIEGINPFMYYACSLVGEKTANLLEVDWGRNKFELYKERERIYDSGKESENGSPLLSSLKGNAACVEIAALGQYIFQIANLEKVGFKSSFVSGTILRDLDDMSGENHSFLVVENLNEEGNNTYLFDIARPYIYNDGLVVQRIFKSEVPFKKEIFLNQSNVFTKAKDLYSVKTTWFGFGDIDDNRCDGDLIREDLNKT